MHSLSTHFVRWFSGIPQIDEQIQVVQIVLWDRGIGFTCWHIFTIDCFWSRDGYTVWITHGGGIDCCIILWLSASAPCAALVHTAIYSEKKTCTSYLIYITMTIVVLHSLSLSVLNITFARMNAQPPGSERSHQWLGLVTNIARFRLAICELLSWSTIFLTTFPWTMAPSFKQLKHILLLCCATNTDSDDSPSVLPFHSSKQDGESIPPQETPLQSSIPIPVDEWQAYDDPGFGFKVLVPGTAPIIE
jgi:hypothetical protein